MENSGLRYGSTAMTNPLVSSGAIVKAAAKRENRTYRGQFNHYLKLILQHEGLLENPDNKKADCTRQSNQSAHIQP